MQSKMVAQHCPKRRDALVQYWLRSGVLVALAALFSLISFQLTPRNAVAQTVPPCSITAAAMVRSSGGDQDWSAKLNSIVYDQKDTGGDHQLHTMLPNGSADTCLTCLASTGGPRTNRHKVNPVWHPSGQWIVAQVEDDWHPLVWLRNSDWMAELIINGMATELYAVSPDGRTWQRLTNYSSFSSSDPGYALGAMAPHFSADGTKLLWSKLIQSNSAAAPFGTFRLMIADFSVATSGTPSLQNVRDITPPGMAFVEAQGFSSDGASVFFAADPDPAMPSNMDIWKMNLASAAPVKLTTDTNWDEHAMSSPSGNKIAYMAGQLGVWAMSSDLMIMNADGSNKQRLTSFNHAGQPGNTNQLTMVAHPTWNATGTRMAVTEQLAAGYPGIRRLWVLDFAGACGQ